MKDDSWEEEVEQIDPEGLLMAHSVPFYNGGSEPKGRRMGWNEGKRLVPQERTCQSLLEWGKEVRSRLEQGHELLQADDPMRMKIGFVDNDTNEALYLGIMKLKMASDDDFEEVGATRATFATEDGRRFFFGLPPEAPHQGASEPILDLEALWMEEAQAEAAEAEARADVKLADEWGKKEWSKDEVRAAVGLKPRAEYLAEWEEVVEGLPEEQQNECRAWRRRSGRTTETCVSAVVTALNGTPVFLKAGALEGARDLLSRAREMKKKCLPFGGGAEINVWRGPGFEGVLFEDHPLHEVGPDMAPSQELIPQSGPLLYRGHKIMAHLAQLKEEEAKWTYAWQVWVIHGRPPVLYKGDSLDELLDQAKAQVDKILEAE